MEKHSDSAGFEVIDEDQAAVRIAADSEDRADLLHGEAIRRSPQEVLHRCHLQPTAGHFAHRHGRNALFAALLPPVLSTDVTKGLQLRVDPKPSSYKYSRKEHFRQRFIWFI